MASRSVPGSRLHYRLTAGALPASQDLWRGMSDIDETEVVQIDKSLPSVFERQQAGSSSGHSRTSNARLKRPHSSTSGLATSPRQRLADKRRSLAASLFSSDEEDKQLRVRSPRQAQGVAALKGKAKTPARTPISGTRDMRKAMFANFVDDSDGEKSDGSSGSADDLIAAMPTPAPFQPASYTQLAGATERIALANGALQSTSHFRPALHELLSAHNGSHNTPMAGARESDATSTGKKSAAGNSSLLDALDHILDGGEPSRGANDMPTLSPSAKGKARAHDAPPKRKSKTAQERKYHALRNNTTLTQIGLVVSEGKGKGKGKGNAREKEIERGTGSSIRGRPAAAIDIISDGDDDQPRAGPSRPHAAVKNMQQCNQFDDTRDLLDDIDFDDVELTQEIRQEAHMLPDPSGPSPPVGLEDNQLIRWFASRSCPGNVAKKLNDVSLSKNRKKIYNELFVKNGDASSSPLEHPKTWFTKNMPGLATAGSRSRAKRAPAKAPARVSGSQHCGIQAARGGGTGGYPGRKRSYNWRKKAGGSAIRPAGRSEVKAGNRRKWNGYTRKRDGPKAEIK
ncbi:hypothetical protein K437DRAFT_252860 [Tilletiaria anomala UBC 951]|uniref:Uncharacterized protein n=1 Tax=Tilletiaria anomala (strain ATCC 24038 / CBS 436.72 / UBC 951) TaxID=1037660 RepID=A0A066WR71_TILAU|nr:uncharacterized protein K437DRAFT_252860 [Tilletiaria anomala UBC 951]KDN53499.1 hypothetical protein K437DRAFT_252860 [Tilletiaria anomala UBC 951]